MSGRDADIITPVRRRTAAYVAYRNARRWATPVMGLSLPVLVLELVMPVLYGRITPAVGVPGAVVVAGLLCAVGWGTWVGAAALAGWATGSPPTASHTTT